MTKSPEELMQHFLATTHWQIDPPEAETVTAAYRFPITPEIMENLKAMNPGHNFKKIEQSSIAHVLRKAGHEAAIHSPIRKRRPGFTISLISNKLVMIVSWTDPTRKTMLGTWREKIKQYERILKAAGYITGYAVPMARDQLFVIRQGSPEKVAI